MVLTLKDCVPDNKRVFLRADLNVPLSPTGTIQDTFRLKSLIPTLTFLLRQETRQANRSHNQSNTVQKIIIATHLGKPKTGSFDAALSTQQLIPWFEQQGISVSFAKDIKTAAQSNAPIVLLENLRFFAGTSS